MLHPILDHKRDEAYKFILNKTLRQTIHAGTRKRENRRRIWRFFVLFVYMGLEVYPLLGMLWIIAPFCIEYRRQYLNRKGQPLAL